MLTACADCLLIFADADFVKCFLHRVRGPLQDLEPLSRPLEPRRFLHEKHLDALENVRKDSPGLGYAKDA